MEEMFLSDDLISEILIRLPVKAIYRSNCVCKRWHDLISSNPHFATRMRSLPPLLSGFFYFDYKKDKMRVSHVSGTAFAPELFKDNSLKFVGCPVYVLDFNNGFLLCVEKIPTEADPLEYQIKAFVCNPYTKQVFALPRPNSEVTTYNYQNALLYCYEKVVSERESSIQFKVIMINCVSDSGDCFKMMIYCSETGEWSVSEISEPNGIFHWFQDMKIIGNSLYIFNGDDGSRRFYTYNLQDGSICSKELPGGTGDRLRGVLGGFTGLVHYVATSPSGIHVWALIDGVKWSLVHSISHESLIAQLPAYSGQCKYCIELYMPRERKLLLHIWHGRYEERGIFWYDQDTRKLQLLDDFHPFYQQNCVPYALPAWFPLTWRKKQNMHWWFSSVRSFCCLGQIKNGKSPSRVFSFKR